MKHKEITNIQAQKEPIRGHLLCEYGGIELNTKSMYFELRGSVDDDNELGIMVYVPLMIDSKNEDKVRVCVAQIVKMLAGETLFNSVVNFLQLAEVPANAERLEMMPMIKLAEILEMYMMQKMQVVPESN